MKKFFKVITYLLLAILIVILAMAAFIWFKNPYGIRSVMQKQIAPSTVQIDESYDHPLLDVEQEKKLRDIGIDPEALPTEVTQEQQDCAVQIVGEERAKELMETQSPTNAEIIKLMRCL